MEVQLAKARADGVKDTKLEKMRPACSTSCHRFRLKGAWAMRVNRGGKVVEKSKTKGQPPQSTSASASMLPSNEGLYMVLLGCFGEASITA